MWGKAIAVGLMLIAIVGVATAIEPDTNIYLTPHPTLISFYNNSTYITCNYTNEETNNVTIRFEQYNPTSHSFNLVTDFGEFGTNTTGAFNIANSNYTEAGWYRAVIYPYGSPTESICSFGIAVRSNESSSFEQLHGSVRFDDANSVPTVSFVEHMAGRGITWLTGSGSLSHSLELWEYGANWTPSSGGSGTAAAATGTLTFSGNTSDGETVNISTDRYEFDTDSSVTGGNIAVDVSGGNNNSTRSCELFAAEVTANDTVGVGASCTGSVATLTADAAGSGGNSITTTETCANAAFASSTLTGGTDAGVPTHPTLIDHTNTSGNETLWALTATYTINRYYALVIYSSDHECLDYQLVQAVVPESNVVEVIAKDVETGDQIMTFTATMADITKTSSDGKIYFTNVTNGEHLITVTATDYITGTQTIYMANNYINTTVHLQRYSPYVPPHFVRFYLVNMLMQGYENVNVTATYTSAAGENITLTGVTGTDGAVTFLLTPTFRHTITFTSASQGISKTLTLYPKDTEYWITVGTTGGWADYEHDPTRYIHIGVSQKNINDTHAHINVTYLDDLNLTTALRMWVNQTNTSDLLGDQILIDTWISPGNNSSTSHSFIVTNYRGQDYMVYVQHEHHEFGTVYSRPVRFIGILIDLGLPTISYAYMSFAILFFMAAMFGATSTSIGGIVTCVTGWLLYAIGWLGILGLVAPICLALASTYAVGVMLADRARKGGYA